MDEVMAKRGARYSDEDAQMLKERFVALGEKATVLTPQAVVEDARPEASPTHRFFEWRDDVAAEQWREQQARQLIDYVVVRESPDAEPVRFFHNVVVMVNGEKQRGYLPLPAIQREPGLLAQVIAQELMRLRACQRNLRAYKALEAVAMSLEEVIQALQTVEPETVEEPVLEGTCTNG